MRGTPGPWFTLHEEVGSPEGTRIMIAGDQRTVALSFGARLLGVALDRLDQTD
jgi:hypothetical protein